ncbi:MAG: hyaluronate lyase [Verrucomicrobiales bacterium]|nr:hyaluronate lyase [Verrucomicrobiales bacterium]
MLIQKPILSRLAALLLAGLWFVGLAASHADEFDALRLKRRDMLNFGTNASSADPNYSNWISSIAVTAQRHWTSLNTSASRAYLWSDRNHLATDSSDISASFGRLQIMALAWSTRNSSLETNASLLTAITNGLDWLYANSYNETKIEYDNFFDWEIAAPLALNDTAVLLYSRLSPVQIANYMNAVDHFSPTPNLTAANKVWKASVVALRGAIVKDAAKIALAGQALSDVFQYSTAGDGFYPDGSFIFHNEFAYNGGYGSQLLQTIAPLMQWLKGSSWEITDPNQANVYCWVYDSFQPFIYQGGLMQMVSGRYYTRSGDDHTDGHDLIAAILQVAQFAPTNDARAFKAMAKAWIQGDTYRNFISTQFPPFNIWAQTVLNDPSISPTPGLVRHYQFPQMDRVLHCRPGWAFGVSMSSSRVANYESIRGENLRGWYTGDGMTWLYTPEENYYADGFWPTVNPYRLPGTTIDTQTRTNASGQSYTGPNNWTGGASLQNLYGLCGMQLNAWGSSLSARKSWFMFDNEIVCLGAGISTVAADNHSVETIIGNRRLTSNGNNPFTVNGILQSPGFPWSQTLTNTQWAHLAGNVSGSDLGFYFPQPVTINGLREARSGAMAELNTTYGSTNRISRNYLTLWYDHGLNPSNASYSYVLLPNSSASQVSTYASNPDIQVLGNNTTAQGVKENVLGITAVNFWKDGTNRLGGITVDKKASVIMRNDGSLLDVGISDPTQTNTGIINLELSSSAAAFLTGDAAFLVQQLTPTIKVAVNMNGSAGQTLHARFAIGTLQTVTLFPTADAYVQNGDQTNVNFGSSSSLAAKAATSSLGRETFMRFDLSSAPGQILSASLRLYPFTVQDPINHGLAPLADNSWTENGLTWNNKPASGPEYTQWLVAASNTPVLIPITSLAQQAASANGQLSLRIYSTGLPTPTNGGYTAYTSKEGSAANRPQLILTMPRIPPVVTLSNLTGLSSFDAPAAVLLGADGQDSDGAITNISIYKGATRMAQSSFAPFSFALTNLSAGQYAFTAVAVDNSGLASTSAPVSISVYNPEPNGRGTGLMGEYFTKTNLVGLAVTRTDSNINFSWGAGSPDGSIPVDNFSVRWSGKLQVRHAGNHKFHLISDDGARLWLGGQLLIDSWSSHILSEDVQSISLVPGQYYDLVVEYYEGTGSATAQLLWTEPGGAKQVVPQSQLYPAVSGLRGFYYASTNFQNSAFYRVDDVVNFFWGDSSPNPALLQGPFSVKWDGKVRANQTGLYTFYTLSDDAVKLTVNNQMIISNWVPHTVTENSGTLSLNAGQFYKITMEFFDANGSAAAVLMWQPPGESKQVIPNSNLTPLQNNRPPALSAIPNVALNPGQNFAFANTALDADLPYQALSYSLDPGAPVGLSLNATTGVLSWSVPSNQPLGDYSVTVRVTDNGNPVMTDAQTFLVTVSSNLTTAYFGLIPTGSVWKYLDTGVEPSASWRNNNFNDNSWKSGSGILGYGTGGETTTVSFGPNSGAKYPATYFRKLLFVPDASKVFSLDARILRNDGAVVYLNGAEIWRDNLPSGTISNQTLASIPITGVDASTYITKSFSPSILLDGTNVLAVELHQSAPNGPDVAFDFELKGFATIPTQVPLTIGRSTNAVALAWPGDGSWYQLFTATNLAPAAFWSRATNVPTLSNGQWSIQVPASTNRAQFFRLQLP